MAHYIDIVSALPGAGRGLTNVYADLTTRVVGTSSAIGPSGEYEQTGYLWITDQNGAISYMYDLTHDVPSDPQTIESAAFSANDLAPLNDAVGWSTVDESGDHKPTVWTGYGGPLRTIRLATLGGAHGEAFDVNNSRKVVGWCDDAAGNRRATMWDLNGSVQPQDLGTIGTSTGGIAYAINAQGQIVGAIDSEKDEVTGEQQTVAFIFTPGATDGAPTNPQMKLLPIGPHETSEVWDVNAAGQVVGEIASFGVAEPHPSPIARPYSKPFVWSQSAGLQILPTFDGDGAAVAINSAGQIVGSARRNLRSVAVVWTGAGAMPLDLNEVTTPPPDVGVPPGQQLGLTGASDVNDSGQIVGGSQDRFGFVLQPLPGPFPLRRRVGWIDDLYQTLVAPGLAPIGGIAKLHSGDAILLLFLAEAAGSLRHEQARQKAATALLDLAAEEIKRALPK